MFIPLYDENPTVRPPIVTVALIILNSAVFYFMWSQGEVLFFDLTNRYGFTPGIFTGMGSSFEVPSWYYLTPFTSMFMHGSWMHLIGNMLFLWIYGNNIEDHFGHVRFLLFYLAAGLAAVALFSAFNLASQTPLVGASGAIAGVMGGYLVLHPKARVTCLFFWNLIQIPAGILLVIWIAQEVLMSVLAGSREGGGVAFLAHVGGFVFGFLVLKFFAQKNSRILPIARNPYGR